MSRTVQTNEVNILWLQAAHVLSTNLYGITAAVYQGERALRHRLGDTVYELAGATHGTRRVDKAECLALLEALPNDYKRAILVL